MDFNLKEMYRYLISHTLPGLLLLVETLFFLYSKHPDDFNKITAIPVAALIVIGYFIATLLGIMLDGLRHFIFNAFLDLKIKDWRHGIDVLRKENIRIAKGNFTALKNNSKDENDCMKVYQHFIEFSEEAIWYPYEAYANISVAMFLGIIILWGMFSLKFWLIYGVVLASLSFEAILIYYFCCDDQEEFSKIYKDK